MTLEKARELLKVHADFGGFYNRNAARLILSQVLQEHGRGAVDALIEELKLQEIFGFEPGQPLPASPWGKTPVQD